MLNSVSLIGRLGKDVTLLQVGDNIKARITLAVARDYKDKEGKNPVDWIDCETWNSAASFLEQYAGIGDLISVQGRLQMDSYEDKDGNRRYRTYVNVDRVNIVAKKINQDNEELTAKPKPTYKKKK